MDEIEEELYHVLALLLFVSHDLMVVFLHERISISTHETEHDRNELLQLLLRLLHMINDSQQLVQHHQSETLLRSGNLISGHDIR